MDIKLSLDRDFERYLDSLVSKYGTIFLLINGIDQSQLDNSEFLSKLVGTDVMANASVDPNSNASNIDIRSFISEKGKSSDKLFGLNKIFSTIKKQWGLRTAKDWLEQEFTKGFYLNDSTSASYIPYCWANSLDRLAREGLFFLNGYNNQPPKHLTTFLDDVVEFVSFLSNRQSGAVGMPDLLIWCYYFWKKDCDTGYYIKSPEYYLRQCFQKIIFRLNQPFLRIDQSAFTNVSIFDRCYVEDLFGGVEFPDGSFAIDNVDEILECEKIFMEVVSEIRTSSMFTFPVITYSLLYKDGKFIDEDFARWCSDHNTKWYDANFFISDKTGILSNCCRLLSDTTKLEGFVNSIGGSGLSIGSCRVSTINLARIAYEAKFDPKKYLKILRERVELDCKALSSMRYILRRNIEKGLLPNYCRGALELDKQFCTIGINGFYNAIDLLGYINTDELGYKSYSDEGIWFAREIFKVIDDVKDNFECDFSFNVEQTPSENSAGVLAHADDILFEQDKYYIYANQWIPLTEKCTIQEKCRLGAYLDPLCGGGAISHINVENRFPNQDSAWDMLNYIAQQGVMYFAFNTKINVDEDNHAFIGTDICPICGKPKTDEYTRVVGFYRPVSSFQSIRRQEFDERRWYYANHNGLDY